MAAPGDLCRAMLEFNGYEVEEVEDGEAAIAAYQKALESG